MSVPAKIEKWMVDGYQNKITRRSFTLEQWGEELKRQASYSRDRGFDSADEAIRHVVKRAYDKVEGARKELARAEKTLKSVVKKYNMEVTPS